MGPLHDSAIEACSQGTLKTIQSCEPQAGVNVCVLSLPKCLGLHQEGWALYSWFDTQSLRPHSRLVETVSPS